MVYHGFLDNSKGFTFVTKVTYALIKSDTNTLICDLCLKVNLTASFQMVALYKDPKGEKVFKKTKLQPYLNSTSNNEKGRTFNSEATSTVETCINSTIT